MILFGHPTGNPNSHQAALAHFEMGRLEAFCVPWMPTPGQLQSLRALPGLKGWASRLQRRCHPLLLNAPRIEGKMGEWGRMVSRIAFPQWADEKLSYQANDWLMGVMSRECHRGRVTAVHSYEDCSLRQFEEAKRLGKACIYDMPIGYYPAWEDKQRQLAREYIDWMPQAGLSASQYARPEQKRLEMKLADLVLAPSHFVLKTIQSFCPNKPVALAPYGVDLQFWRPRKERSYDGYLRFLFAGQISIRKGIPVLLEAWRKAEIRDASLELVGFWNLSREKQINLPQNVIITGPCSRDSLREKYQSADVYILPSFFEGLALAGLEAMACGLPLIATEVLDGMDLIKERTGRSIRSGNVDDLVESLHWFSANRDRLPSMKLAARSAVESFSWERYRDCVSRAVSGI